MPATLCYGPRCTAQASVLWQPRGVTRTWPVCPDLLCRDRVKESIGADFPGFVIDEELLLLPATYEEF